MNLQDAPVTLTILIVTVLTSLAAFFSPGVVRDFAISPSEVLRNRRWHQIVTSGFLHGSIGHLLVNMLTLYFFGPQMEAVLGGRAFSVLYMGSMICGSLATILLHRNDPRYRAVGASGAVTGIVFGFVLFRPFARIYLFLLPIGIPAILFAIGYVLLSLYGIRSGRGRIGHAAHLGGAMGGILLTILLHPSVVRIFLSNFH
jgi:membrane associated rhomboid family serine protease